MVPSFKITSNMSIYLIGIQYLTKLGEKNLIIVFYVNVLTRRFIFN
jgi:hypothetical protein